MSDRNSTDNPAAPALHPDSLTDEQLEAIAREGKSEKPTPYDRLVEITSMLDCVLSVLEHETEEALPRYSHLSSAELVLRRSIAALYELGGDVENQTMLIAKMREVAS